MRSIILYVCCFLINGSFIARTQHFQCKVHDLGMELAEMKPSVIFRDSFGLVWVGTEKGLVRYDGENLEIFSDVYDITTSVSALYTVGRTLWIGFNNGSIFTFENEVLNPVIFNDKKVNSRITGIRRLSKGQMVFSTYGSGILILSPEGKIARYDEADGILSDEIYCMEQTSPDAVFIGTDKGVQQIRAHGADIDCNSPDTYKLLEDEVILSLFWDNDYGALIAGTFENGVILFTDPETDANQWLQGKSVTGVTSGPGRNFYLVTEDKGHFYILNSADKTIKKEKICKSEEIIPVAIHCDTSGVIWIICQKNGLVSIDSRFYHYPVPVSIVQAIAVYDSIIFFADGETLFSMNINGQLSHLVKRQNVLSMHVDTVDKKLYCGTFGSGILIYEINTEKHYFLNEKNGLLNNNVISVVQKGDEIWTATLGGISILNKVTGKFRHLTKSDGLTTGYNYSLFKDSRQNILVGSDGFGLIFFDTNGKQTAIPSRHSIISIAEAKNNEIWYSTTDNILYRVNNEEKTSVAVIKGLHPGVISGISNDQNGNIYVFHPGSIDIINTEGGMIVNYGHNQNFKEINTLLHGLAMDAGGDIWFTDAGKIIRFNPPGSQLKPDLFVKRMLAGDTEIAHFHDTVLQHSDNDIQVEYCGVWYDNPAAIKYRYKLTGFNEDWIYTRDKKLIIPNLAPGQYTFTIESDIHDGFIFPARYIQTFKIRSPFYSTWWFYFICTLCLVSVIYVTVRIRERRKRQIQQLTTDKIRSELEMIKSQIDPHFLFNSFNTLISAIETNPEDALKFAGRMSDFYRTILDYRDKDLITLQEEMAIIDNYLYLLYARFGSNLVIHTQIEAPGEYLIIPLTLQMIIENAIKHNIVSALKPLKIDIIQMGDVLQVINPLQLRRDRAPSTHFGLEALVRRYHAYTGREMSSSIEHGNFEVKIPLKRKEQS